jgi:HEAT repeat protein
VGPVFGILVAATVGSVVYLIASERQRARLRAWRATAERVGLEAVEESEGGIFRGASLTARSGALRVRMERYQHGKYDVGTRIVVGGLAHGSYGLSLRREGLTTAIEKSLIGEREIELGASEFDREFFVQGQPALALAVLDRATRPLLTRLLRGQIGPGGEDEVRASLSDGVLTVEIRERLFSDPLEKLPSALAAALEVGRRLVAPGDTAARIAENVRDEPEASARLRGLLLLAREFPDHPATRERLLAARGDASAEVRLRAAMALGEEGRSTLVALVRDEGSSDAVAAKAVAALGDGIPVDLAEATLRRVAGTPESTETTVACLDALGRLGRVEAEGLLIEALKSSEPQVRAAAARALGRAGTVAAVAALHEAMEARREISRSVGRQAIAEIQSRLSGAAPGQLSLSGAEAGALSLADGEPGRLSIAAPEAELDSGDDPAAGSRARPAERE